MLGAAGSGHTVQVASVVIASILVVRGSFGGEFGIRTVDARPADHSDSLAATKTLNSFLPKPLALGITIVVQILGFAALGIFVRLECQPCGASGRQRCQPLPGRL